MASVRSSPGSTGRDHAQRSRVPCRLLRPRPVARRKALFPEPSRGAGRHRKIVQAAEHAGIRLLRRGANEAVARGWLRRCALKMGVFGLPSSSEKLAGWIAWGGSGPTTAAARGSVLSRTGALIHLTLEGAERNRTDGGRRMRLPNTAHTARPGLLPLPLGLPAWRRVGGQDRQPDRPRGHALRLGPERDRRLPRSDGRLGEAERAVREGLHGRDRAVPAPDRLPAADAGDRAGVGFERR